MKRWCVTALTATKCHDQLFDRYICRITWDICGETRPWGNPSRKDEAWWIFTHWKAYCPILPIAPCLYPLKAPRKSTPMSFWKSIVWKFVQVWKFLKEPKSPGLWKIDHRPTASGRAAPQKKELRVQARRRVRMRESSEDEKIHIAISDKVSESSLNTIKSRTMTNVAVLLVFKKKNQVCFHLIVCALV